MSEKSLSILIPNYNGKKLLEDYLPSTIIAAKNSNLSYEIIIVDDASTDDSVAFLRSNYPEVTLQINAKNQGFSKTCNVGIQIAKNKLLLILNSDIKLSPNYFQSQLKYFDIPNTFGVMSHIKDQNNPSHIERAQTLTRFGFKMNRKPVNSVYFNNKEYPTIFLSGANALVDLDKIKTIGGFNELFSPYYFEDADLSIRAWRMGWKCYFDNFSTCEHLGSFTIKNSEKAKNIKRVYYRNKFIINALHLKANHIFFLNLQILLLTVIPKLLIGNFWIFNSFMDYLKRSKKILVENNEFKNLMLKNKSKISLWDLKEIIKNLQPN